MSKGYGGLAARARPSGPGPAGFLRHRRLGAVHSILHDSAPGSTTIAAVAMQQGFYELGRFSQYYLAMFGEHPSQTLGVAPFSASKREAV